MLWEKTPLGMGGKISNHSLYYTPSIVGIYLEFFLHKNLGKFSS